MRFTLFCIKAPKLPMVMERAAEIQTSQNHSVFTVAKSTHSITANAAAFGPVDSNATTGAGAPSYTSGVQMGNGAEAILKPSPTTISADAGYARAPRPPPFTGMRVFRHAGGPRAPS